MSDFEMDFQWWRSGYDFEDWGGVFAKQDKYRKDEQFLSGEEYDFEGATTATEKLAVVVDRLKYHFGKIIPKGPRRLYRPDARTLDSVVEALLRLTEGVDLDTVSIKNFRAHLKAQTAAILKMASMVGLLYDDSKGESEESPLYWFELGVQLKAFFEFSKNSASAEIPTSTNLELFLVSSLNGSPTLAMRPTDLGSAMTFHAVRSIAGGTTFHSCEGCKLPFLAGGSRGRGKKKAGAQFCCEQCRWNHNNAKRRKA